MEKILEFFLKVAEKLSRSYMDGEIDLADFQIGFRNMLRRLYTTMLIAGTGGQKPGDINPTKFLEMGNVLRRQYRFLERFMRKVAAGELSEEQIMARAFMYVQASEQMYWRGVTDVTLPAYPRDGSSECLMHCGCSWELNYRVDDAGNKTHLLATWALGPTEHCATCEQRAVTWNPLVIPLGV